MTTISEELTRLRRADVQIADAMRRIERQRALIASMAAGSEQQGRGKALLRTMQLTLTQFMTHRAAMLQNVERLRRQQAGQAR